MSSSFADQSLTTYLRALPESERAAAWESACAENPGLRDHTKAIFAAVTSAAPAPDPFPRPLAVTVPTTLRHGEIVQGLALALETDQTESAGALIGHYKLLQKIGEGGFGIVWMAEQQEPIHRRVALKIIKAGMDTKEVIARFEAERQALAMMDHPNIARVFDAGATGTGRPYFVMELVRGIPISRYCDEVRMPPEARLRLFIPICHAVQHAHQKGVIHRDLKPSNILITLHDGVPVPKIIDFGIAKATTAPLTDKTLFTQFHSFVGTPVYTSPEQMEMSGLDVDTRSDIYSLGVLLYELLTGRPPFDPEALVKSGLDAMRRTIREIDPPRPSQRLHTLPAADRTTIAHQRNTEVEKLAVLLRGDVDWIVMHCLEKDRMRRYDTATALATDIQHHLQSEPVAARPPSELYRLGKFVRRHRVGVAAVMAIALSLVGGLITASTLLVRERAARQRAVVAENSESKLRQQAEAARSLETKRVARTALTLADQLLEQGRIAEGLAYLVQAARKDPGNPTLAPRLVSELAAHTFLQPDGAPLQLGSRVRRCEFSADGQRLRLLGEDGTLAAVNLTNGEVLKNKSSSPPSTQLWGATTERERVLLGRDGVVRIFDHDTTKLVRELRFDKRAITATAAGSKSNVLWVRLEDESVVLADIATGTTRPLGWETTRLTNHHFTNDGHWYVGYADSSSELYVRDMATGEKFKTLALGGPLKKILVSPDGNRLVTIFARNHFAPASHDLQIWSLPDLHPLSTAQPVDNSSVGVGSDIPLAVSSDSRWLLVITTSGKQIYSLATGAREGAYLNNQSGHELFSPDGLTFTSAVTGGLQLYHTATGLPATPPMRHAGEIRTVKFSINGAVLLTTCSDGFTRLWNTTTGQLLAEPTLHQPYNVVTDLSPDGQRLAIGTGDGTVYRLRVGPGEARPLALPRVTGTKPAFFMKEFPARLLWLEHDRAVALDAASGRLVEGGFRFPEPIRNIESLQRNVAIRPDQRYLTVFTASGKWQAWELGRDGGITRVIPLDDAPTGGAWISFSPTGDRVALVADQGGNHIRFWDLTTGRTIGAPCTHTTRIGTNAIPGAFSPDASRFVAGTITGEIKVWDVATGRELRQLAPPDGIWIRCVAYHPDGTRILTANFLGTMQLWDATTGQPVRAIPQHNGTPRSLEFSRDGKLLLTSATDRTARLWDGHHGTPLGEPMRHEGIVRSAAFSADGLRIVTASEDATARTWDAPTGQPISTPWRHPTRVAFSEFSPDGRFVNALTAATPAHPSTSWLWSVPPNTGGAPAPEWLLHLATIRATKIINEAGQCIDVPAVMTQLDDVRHALAALPQDDPFVAWGRWLLDESANRPIAPGFTITPTEAETLTAKFSAAAASTP